MDTSNTENCQCVPKVQCSLGAPQPLQTIPRINKTADIKTYRKNYYAQNKQKKIEYMNGYNEQHKDALRENGKMLIYCSACGIHITKYNASNHRKTKKHLTALKTGRIIPEFIENEKVVAPKLRSKLCECVRIICNNECSKQCEVLRPKSQEEAREFVSNIFTPMLELGFICHFVDDFDQPPCFESYDIDSETDSDEDIFRNWGRD